MKVALVHDWLTGMRGGEKVLESLCDLYPEADIYTLVHVPGAVSPAIEKHRIFTSFLQKMPFAKEKYRYYLPLMPYAIEKFDLKGYDLVISSSHCVAKGCISSKETLHVNYCHTPMRYIWDMYDQYFNEGETGFLTKTAMRAIAPYLRKWDSKSSSRVDHFIANSSYVQKRIQKWYDRDAEVIHPWVDLDKFSKKEDPEDFYLIVSALVPYKRIDLAVDAFNVMKKPLKIIGSGPERDKLRKKAKNNIEFLEWRENNVLVDYYSRCKALIFPGEEDFGLVPLEVMACGRPVIAYGRGGVLETVVPVDKDKCPEEATGVFFNEQTKEGIIDAVHSFEKICNRFNPEKIRKQTELFNREIFMKKINQFIEDKLTNAKKT